MADGSITGTDSFRFRAQRSEETRLIIIASAFCIALVGNIVRRIIGGQVVASNAAFFPIISILSAAIAYELWTLSRTHRASAQGLLIPTWRWQANAILELAVPASLMLILHFDSSRGEYSALSSPVVLVFPIIILLSILRLRPGFTLATGAGAAAFHWSLTSYAIATHSIPPHHGPIAYTYGMILFVTGLAGSGVSRAVRRYVIETVDDVRSTHHRATGDTPFSRICIAVRRAEAAAAR